METLKRNQFSKVYVDINGVLHYDAFLLKGDFVVRRDDLAKNHPEQTYNYIKSFGISPEFFGIANPNERSISELIAENSRLKRRIQELTEVRLTKINESFNKEVEMALQELY